MNADSKDRYRTPYAIMRLMQLLLAKLLRYAIVITLLALVQASICRMPIVLFTMHVIVLASVARFWYLNVYKSLLNKSF